MSVARGLGMKEERKGGGEGWDERGEKDEEGGEKECNSERRDMVEECFFFKQKTAYEIN